MVSERHSDETTVRITNLPEDSDTLEEDLRKMFSKAGKILRSYVARDKIYNKPKGFALLLFNCEVRQKTQFKTLMVQNFNI